MLADVAYEQLGRVVRGDWDRPDAGQGESNPMEEDENGDEGGEWRHKVLRDLQVIVKRDILGWLFGYMEGERNGIQRPRHTAGRH
jgi:hypothetical protein